MKTLKVLILESFFTGSHQKWAEDLKRHSQCNVTILSLPGRHWKWRMHGGAVTLARQYMQMDNHADVILCTDMIDLALFKSLTIAKSTSTQYFIYFHENQITYPWSTTDPDISLKRDNHYGFINYSSALVADKVIFNSHYHKQSFCNALGPFLKQFPDFQNQETVKLIQAKSVVIPIGFDFKPVPNHKKQSSQADIKTILWNHRWEYDKNPDLFFQSLFALKQENIRFRLIVLGKQAKAYPKIFDVAKTTLQEEIIHYGYCEDRNQYERLLQEVDILPVCSHQDFFGMSVVESIGLGIFPLLPDRLAYPEHIPEKYKQLMLYQTDEDFLQRIRCLLIDPLPEIEYSWIYKYDWQTVIHIYDRAFNQET